MTTLDEALDRLAQEQAYLNHAQHGNNPTAIALAQSHVRYWESVVAQKRLEDAGGWKGPHHD